MKKCFESPPLLPRRFGILTVIFILASTTFISAQVPSSISRPLASQLASLMLNDSMYAELLSQGGIAAATASRAMLEVAIGRKLADHEIKKLQLLFRDSIRDVVPRSQWDSLYANVISRLLSDEEARTMIAFYQNPVSKKLPALTAAGSAGGVDLVKIYQAEISMIFIQRFEKEFSV